MPEPSKGREIGRWSWLSLAVRRLTLVQVVDQSAFYERLGH